MGAPFGRTPLNRLWDRTSAYVPPVGVCETADDVLVTASLPGIDASKVSIEYTDGTVTISGERQPFTTLENQQVTTHLNGIPGIPRYGNFQFAFTLPCEVNTSQAEAR